MADELFESRWKNSDKKKIPGKPALTRPLTRRGRFGRSLVKRFIYSQMAIWTGFKIAIGKEHPLIEFKIEQDPPSVYWVYRIKSSAVEDLGQNLGIPPQFSLSPIRCLEGDEPEYLLVVNAYRVSGLAKGLRAEWSVFVRDASGTPCYLVVDARSSTASMDPVSIITKASTVIHERVGDAIHTQIGDGDEVFVSAIALPESKSYVSSSPEWVSANDHIYWGNGLSDRTFYNAGLADARQIRIKNEDVKIQDSSFWGQLVEPEPIHVLVVGGSIELVISPWANVDQAEIW